MADITIDDIAKMEPGREADYAIAKLVEWSDRRFLRFCYEDSELVNVTNADGEVMPHYTTSLDAALPWEDIDWVQRMNVHGDESEQYWLATHVHEDITFEGRHPTSEAFARRLAALRAREHA